MLLEDSLSDVSAGSSQAAHLSEKLGPVTALLASGGCSPSESQAVVKEASLSRCFLGGFDLQS